MRRRLSSYLSKKRDALIANYWETAKAEITMVDLGKMFDLSSQQTYQILKSEKEKRLFERLKKNNEIYN